MIMHSFVYFWGFGDTQVYADGVLALNVDDLVLPDR